MRQIVTASHPVRIDQGSCPIDEFETCVERTTGPVTVPLADDIRSNAPVYEAGAIRAALDDAARLSRRMTEWNGVFKDGAGIVVFHDAFDDVRAVDKVT